MAFEETLLNYSKSLKFISLFKNVGWDYFFVLFVVWDRQATSFFMSRERESERREREKSISQLLLIFRASHFFFSFSCILIGYMANRIYSPKAHTQTHTRTMNFNISHCKDRKVEGKEREERIDKRREKEKGFSLGPYNSMLAYDLFRLRIQRSFHSHTLSFFTPFHSTFFWLYICSSQKTLM